MSRIRVAIDQVVLTGIEAGERQAVIDGLRAELAAALAGGGPGPGWARPWRRDVLRLPGITAEPGPGGGRRLGRSVGRAVGRSLRP
jgi:hypothetical protein